MARFHYVADPVDIQLCTRPSDMSYWPISGVYRVPGGDGGLTYRPDELDFEIRYV